MFITGVPIHELFTILYDGVEMLMDAMFIPEKETGLISAILIVLRNVTSLILFFILTAHITITFFLIGLFSSSSLILIFVSLNISPLIYSIMKFISQ